MSRPVATVRALMLAAAFSVSATSLHSAPPDPQVEALYLQGQAALDSCVNDPDDRSHGRLEEALSALDCVVVLDPSHVDALVARAKVHFHSDRYQEAIDDANRAIKLDPKSAAAYCIRGRVREFAEEDPEKALADLNKAIELGPKLAEAYYGRGNMHRRNDKFPEAIADYTTALRIEPNRIRTLTNRCRAYGNSGDMDKALCDIETIIRIYPNSSTGYIFRACYYDWQGDYDKANADLDKALQISPDSLSKCYDRAAHLEKRECYDAAIVGYSKVLEHDPTHIDALESRATCYLEQNQLDKASDDIDSAMRINPKSGDIYCLRGVLYLEQEKTSEAITDFDKAIELGVSYLAGAYNKRSAAYIASNDLQAALADVSEAVHIEPTYQLYRENRIIIACKLSDWQLVVTDLNILLESNCNDVKLLAIRGYANDRLGDFHHAIADYTSILSMRPNNERVIMRRGLAFSKKGEWDAAMADYEHLVALDPDNSNIYIELGIRGFKQRSYEDVIACCTFALRINPDEPWAYATRSFAHFFLDHFEQALADFDEAIQRDMKDAIIYTIRGYCLARLDRMDEAIASMEKAGKAASDESWRSGLMGATYSMMSGPNFDKALTEINRMLKKNPNNVWILKSRADLYYQKNQLGNALADYSKIIELQPDYANVYFLRAVARWRLMDSALKRPEKCIHVKQNNIETNSKNNHSFFQGVSKLDYSGFDEILKDERFVPRTTAVDATPSGNMLGEHDQSDIYRHLRKADDASNLAFKKVLEDIDKAIELNPDNAIYYFVRSKTHKHYEQALTIADLDRAIEVDPEYAFAYIDRAKIHRSQKNLDAALADCNSAIELDPENKEYYSERAVVYTARGEHEKADADFKRAYRTGRKSSSVR